MQSLVPYSQQSIGHSDINKETVNFSSTVDYMYLIDIFQTLHPTAEYTFKLKKYFSRIDFMLGHKKSSNKSISNIISYHNGIQLRINKRRKAGKFTNTWKLNNIRVNNQCIKDVKIEIKKIY